MCILVCIDIEILVEVFGPKSLRWSLGPCSSGNNDNKYYKNGNYKERCCLSPGIHILSCYSNDQSLGWRYVQIRINGHIYCDDFISLKAMRKIVIHGTYYFQRRLSLIINIMFKGYNLIDLFLVYFSSATPGVYFVNRSGITRNQYNVER